jgi:2-amino-4-hydroxy-6-hydroxymethyldihydropteridine diphosphokinase
VDATRWFPAYVALGSNLDDPPAQVARAFTALEGMRGTRMVARSSLYRSRPFGPVAQPDFVNAVAGMLTTLDAVAMLAELKGIDLDLLVHGTTRIDEPQIKVPHPGIAERAFVLVPLAEVAPDLDVPGVGRVRTMAARVDEAGLSRMAA